MCENLHLGKIIRFTVVTIYFTVQVQVADQLNRITIGDESPRKISKLKIVSNISELSVFRY